MGSDRQEYDMTPFTYYELKMIHRIVPIHQNIFNGANVSVYESKRELDVIILTLDSFNKESCIDNDLDNMPLSLQLEIKKTADAYIVQQYSRSIYIPNRYVGDSVVIEFVMPLLFEKNLATLLEKIVWYDRKFYKFVIANREYIPKFFGSNLCNAHLIKGLN